MADDTLVGKNLGQYEVLSLLGRGLFSAVYRAYQASVNRTVALKVLPADFLRDPKFIETFEREARLLMQLEHFHVLPLYDVGQADGRPFLVMRYMPGGTLGNLLARYGRLSVAESVPIIQQVAAALDYAHGRGILHRDLKPSNILVDEEGTAYVSDFGISVVRDAITILTGSGITGGVAYSPPEQLGGGRKISPAVDVYALGAVLYHVLTGKLPFQGANAVETAKQILGAAPASARKLNPDIPPEVDAVLLKALAKEPKGRFPMAGALAQALSIAAGVTTDAVRRGLPPDDTSGMRRVPPKPPAGPLTPPPGTVKAVGKIDLEDDQPTPPPMPAVTPPARKTSTPPPGSQPAPTTSTPHPGTLTPPPGRGSSGAGARTDSSVTPLLRTPPSGQISLEDLSSKDRREFKRAREAQMRRRGGAGSSRIAGVLALLVVLVLFFFVGAFIGQRMREDAQDRDLAAIHASQTVAAGTAYERATQTADALIVIAPTTEEVAVTEATEAALTEEATPTDEIVPTETDTPVIAPMDTPTPRAEPTETPTPVPTVAGGGQGLIAYVSEEDSDAEIYFFDLSTGQHRQITYNAAIDGNPAWSPDGARLAFESAETPQGQHIYTVDATGENRQELTTGIRVDSSPIWSPDGSLIAFHSLDATRSYIRTIDAAGQEETLVQIPPGPNNLMHWSEDGLFITYYGFSPAGNLATIQFNVETDERIPLAGGVEFVDISPDGSRVVFALFVSSTRRQLYIADNNPACRTITDCNTQRLTNDQFNYLTPRFSPDGAVILVASNLDGDLNLYLMDLNGNILQKLTDSRFDDYDAVWQPVPAR